MFLRVVKRIFAGKPVLKIILYRKGLTQGTTKLGIGVFFVCVWVFGVISVQPKLETALEKSLAPRIWPNVQAGKLDTI